MMIDRRSFLAGAGLAAWALAAGRARGADSPARPPNVILCMADDMGWGDTGYNGHPVLKTPSLDRMAAEGLRFDRFYSGAPVCSPTRGSCLTGRHPYRYGIFSANVGHMPKEEITLAEALKTRGYATGHFGKWHLGTLSKDGKDGRRGGRGDNPHYAPPWEHGFDVCFSTEQAVPTWDPMKDQSIPTRYWTGEGKAATENLEGDDSRVIMDRAVPFIRSAAKEGKPFFAVIWFHAPHEPVVGGEPYRVMYPGQGENKQHYYACITALDEQMGRLRKELRDLGIDGNTMLWFCSDNGPAGRGGGTAQEPGGRQQGSAGPFRGRKGSLFEGGVRVPGILVWPDRVKKPAVTTIPCSTADYFPTVLASISLTMKGQPEPIDGVNLLPLLDGQLQQRPRPIGFESGKQIALNDNRYKLISQDAGKTWLLYDMVDDPAEKKDLAAEKPDVVKAMSATLESWRASCTRSRAGEDYRD